MDAYPREAWKRLGQRLKQRRPQIDTRYRIRKIFAQEHEGLTDKTVQEIENAYRETFSDVMLSTVERAYQLKPGSIERFLAGEGELEPAEPVAQVSQVEFTTPELRPQGVRVERYDERHLRADVVIDTGVTMDEAIKNLGDLSDNERAAVAMLRGMEYEPAEVAGAVLMLRELAASRAGRAGAGRRKA